MRRLKDPQGVLDFQGSRLAITVKYYERYMAIGELLDGAPKILQLAHADLREALESIDRERERERRGDAEPEREHLFSHAGLESPAEYGDTCSRRGAL